VDLRRVDFLARAPVELRDGAVLVAGDDEVGERAPAGDGGFAVFEGDFQTRLVGEVGVGGDPGDVERDDCPQEAHALLSHGEEFCAVVAELDAFDGLEWRFSVMRVASCRCAGVRTVLKSHVFTHFPVAISHILIVLSAPPEARRVEVGSGQTVHSAP